MDVAVLAESLTKYYGKVLGIEDVDLEVRVGEVFGFLGPNGAGKSTTIRLLLDFIRPTRGRAEVLGLDTRGDVLEIHRRVGYLPGELALYDSMTGDELIEYFTSLRRIGTGRARALAERLELDTRRLIRSYSTGNRQKLAIVQAFMHDPELLILDEPTGGLDPLMQLEFYRMVDEVRDEGRTVFVSSHVLPEVERLADRVGVVRRGLLVAVETIADLKAKTSRRLEIRFGAPVDVSEFAALPSVKSVTEDQSGRVVQIVATGSIDEVIKAAARHEVVSLLSHDGNLEEAFLAYYSGDERGDDAP